jgi:hypothetical protein
MLAFELKQAVHHRVVGGFRGEKTGKVAHRTHAIAMLPDAGSERIQSVRFVALGIVDDQIAVEFLDDYLFGPCDGARVIETVIF